MRRSGMIWMVAALFALSLGLAACGGGGGDEGGTSTTSNVTLSGTMTVAPGTGTAAVGGAVPFGASTPLLSNNPLNYTLYCVTFTDPTHSGTGTFDASGNFSVTIADAAGLSVGCFITETASGMVASTITFTLSATETGSTASFSGGTHTVTINFDADTGEATADVQAVASAPSAGSGTFTPADLVDEWTMTCAPPDGTEAGQAAWQACLEFVPPRVLVNVITANVDTNNDGTFDTAKYAMAAWRSLAAYNQASGGTHEGIASGALPPEVDPLSLQYVGGGDPTNGAGGGFGGFTAGLTYNAANDYFTMSGTNVLAALNTAGLTYTDTFDDTSGGPGFCTVPVGSLNLSLQADRQCLLQYLEYLNQQVETLVPFDAPTASSPAAAALYLPRLDDRAWDLFGNPADGVATGGTNVPFRAVVASPDIRARYAMMDLEVSGNTMIANEHESHPGTKFDMSGPCTWYHSTTITFTQQAGGTGNLIGWFVSADGNDCGTMPQSNTATFKVLFTPLNTTPTMALSALDGNYVSGCEIEPNGSGGMPNYRSTTLQVSGGSATVNEYHFGTNGCGGPTDYAIVSQATVSLLEDRPTLWSATPAALAGVTITSSTVKLYSDSAVTDFNAANGGSGAYGNNAWLKDDTPYELVAAGNITNYDGTTSPANVYELFYKDTGGKLYVGIDESRNAYGVPVDVKPQFVPAPPSTADLASLNNTMLGTFCMQDNRVDYNALSRSQTFEFNLTAPNTGTVTVTETYHSTADCDFANWTVKDVQVIDIVDDTVSSQPLTTRGFASPMTATINSAGSYSHLVSVNDSTAATNMSNANAGAGAFGIKPWTNGDTDISVGTLDYDGVTDTNGGSIPVAVVDTGIGYLFLATPDSSGTNVAPVNGDGYAVVVDSRSPGAVIDTALAAPALQGTWVSSCSLQNLDADSSYMVIALDNAGNATSTEYYFTGDTQCHGTPSVTTSTPVLTVNSPTPQEVQGGTGPVFRVHTNESPESCGLMQLRGGLLLANFSSAAATTCAPGDYPTSFDVNSAQLERVETPLDSSTLPLAAFTSCRNDNVGVATDEMEFLRVFGDAVLVRNVRLSTMDGSCGGTVSSDSFWAGDLTFNSVVSTERGPANQATVFSPFMNQSMNTILHLEQSHLYVGDDTGVVPPAYPTKLSPNGYERSY